MKRNEVRIGNIIECTWYYMDKVCTEIMPININDLIDIEDEYYKPVPLTQEWLLKCGAKPRFQNTEFIYNRFRIVFKESYGYWYVIDTDSLAYITKVEFVHEWQNFIFTLTGDELTFNLKEI